MGRGRETPGIVDDGKATGPDVRSRTATLLSREVTVVCATAKKDVRE